MAAVLIERGEFREAVRLLRRVLGRAGLLGGLAETATVLLIEALYLEGCTTNEIAIPAEVLALGDRDPRLSAASSVALALAAHARNDCDGECGRAARELEVWERRGARFVAAKGRVQLEALRLAHDATRAPHALRAIIAAERFGSLPHMRWWLRRYASFIDQLASAGPGWDVVLRVAEVDAEFWLPHIVGHVARQDAETRKACLDFIRRRGSAETAEQLRPIRAGDVVEVRRHVLRHTAKRLYVRSFGPLTVQREGWLGPEIRVDKRRIRLLLGLLTVSNHRSLTREAAIEHLWPEADPEDATNSLNQAVFHLRRILDDGSRDPDRPQYIVSSPETISFDADLVVADLDEVRRLARLLKGATTDATRREAAVGLIDLIRGEYLADLRYEDWAAPAQASVHAEVREPLLALASADAFTLPPHLALRAAELLTEFDPFDESAHVAMARKLAEVGQRAAAKRLITKFAESLELELQAPPSSEVRDALLEFGRSSPLVQ